MQPPRPAAIVPTVLIGLVAGVYGVAAFAIALHIGDGDGYERWLILYQACASVQLVAVAYGAASAARHFGYQRGVMIATACVFGFAALWDVAGNVLLVTAGSSSTAWRWVLGSEAIVLVAGTILLAIGTGAWRLAPVAAVFALLVAVASPTMPYLEDA